MQNALPEKVGSYIKAHIRQKRWKRILTVLACVVVFCTTYALILPAITMTGETFCGKEAHRHTEECYEKILICGMEEATGEQDTQGHTHTEDCYAVQQVLSCGQEESEGHVHTSDCYGETLLCAQEESEGHTHTDDCYTEQSVLICGQEATALPEGTDGEQTPEGHVHTDACYEKRLICEKEEHEHTLACYSNPDADTDAPALPTLSGNAAADAAAIAEAQLGYTESSKNFAVAPDGELTYGYTCYGAAYGDAYAPDWSALFVRYCLDTAGVSEDFPCADTCAGWIDALTAQELYHEAASYTPKPGDVAFYDLDGDGAAEHAGIVLDAETVAVGDVNGAVAEESLDAALGFGVLPTGAPAKAPAVQAGEVLPTITVSTDPSTSHGDNTTGFYTGEAATTTLTISNPDSTQIETDDGTVIRLYMQFEKTASGEGHPESADGAPTQKDGTYTIKANGSDRTYEYTVTRIPGEDADHYTYCFEIQRPLQGDTIALNLSSAYPSPASAGGKNTVWGVVLTKDQKEALDQTGADGKPGIAAKPADGSNTQTLTWDTKPNRYTLEKSSGGQIRIVGKSDNISYVDDLVFTIKGARSGDTLEGVGKDHVYKMVFEDTMTLPENFHYDTKIAQAIRNNEYNVIHCHDGEISFYLKDVDFKSHDDAFIVMSMKDGSGSREKFDAWAKTDGLKTKLSLSEDGKSLKIAWYAEESLVRTDNGETVPTFDAGFSGAQIEYMPNTVLTDTNKLEAEKTYQIKNSVSRTDSFCWSADQTVNASCEMPMTVGEAKFTLKKSSLGSEYLGEGTTYTITAGNEGNLPYDKLAYLRDLLPNRVYMSAKNLETLFTDPTYGKGASVKITNATFCAAKQGSVKDMAGNAAGSTAARNTSGDENTKKYEGMSDYHAHIENSTGTLSIAWSESEEKLVLTTGSGEKVFCGATAAEIQKALDSLNFLVTNLTQYEVTWARLDESGKPLPIYGNTEYKITLPVTYKDTFMLLEADWKHTYPNDTVEIGENTVYAEDTDRAQIKSAKSTPSKPAKREFELRKDVTRNNAVVNAIQDGDVLDYALYVAHNGEGAYDLLPLTDHMSGTQALLAEKDQNQSAAWAKDCKIVTDNGKEYYLLSKPGEYQGVWLNGYYADSVKVTAADDGLDTIIKWYFKDYKNTRSDTITYHAMVCPSELNSTSPVFSIGNESWLNDHQTHRLYAPIEGISGTIYVFNKKIVSKEDVEAAADKKEAGVDECAVKEGQTIYYRFTIYPTSDDGYLTLTGRDLLDRLPLGFSKDGTDYLRWKKGAADTENPGEVWIVGYQGYTDLKNSDNWSIGEDGTTDQQRIVWGDDFSVTITDKPLYIYVRVTFPTGAQWEEYGAQYGNTTLENTLYVKGVADTVRHTLGIPAKAYLQKGVLNEFGVPWRFGSSLEKSDKADTLFYYSNNDLYKRYVSYYAVVYNGGSTRLYLSDLQDVLPRGFTFTTMVKDPDEGDMPTKSSVYTDEGFWMDEIQINMDDPDKKPVWVEAKVTADPSKDGVITFHIDGGNNTNKIQQIRYDEQRGRYYLEPNEAIRIMYRCATNNVEDTLDVAENSILMPYFDFNHGGVEVSETHFSRTTSGWDADSYSPNDGNCDVIDNTQAVSLGCTGVSNDTQWLISSVKQVRDEIKPGITKKLASTLSDKGVETTDPIAAHPSDTLRWKVFAANDSHSPIVDYTLTDTMQAPYCFIGKFTYVPDESSNTEGRVEFTLSEPNKKGKIEVKATYREGAQTATVTVNGDSVELKAYGDNIRNDTGYEYPTFSLRITKADTPNAPYTLSLRFQDVRFGIPGGGCGVLTLDTKRVDKTLENKVFVNTCFITPMSQTWDNTTNKGNMTTLDDVFGEDNKPTVRNSAPVTTAYGYVTSSLKSVEEKADPNNKATCNETPNYIVLPGKESLFTYTLSVDAPDNAAMDKLILIDGLPDVGDHSAFQTDDPRYSEFKVAFADTPNVSVTVTTGDGTGTTLDAGQYTVEYSSKTEFAKEDWMGTSTWNENAANARSLRVKIEDTAGTLIPAKSKVSVRFDAKISGDAKPGQIAWNSFGYHYSVVGDSNELEAAPLKVGVMIPSVPEIVKQIVDQDGNTAKAKADKTFRFLLYTGESLKERDEAKLGAALTADSSRKATLIELTVKAGESASEKMSLSDRKVWTYENGAWKEGTDSWTWEANAKYTLVELPDSDPTYKFSSVNGSTTGTGYTFTYAKDKTLTLTAVNRLDLWSFTIQKTDAADGQKTLTGAWFALYSPEQSDRMTEEAYNRLTEKPTTTPDFTLTVGEGENAKTWYLCQLAQTRDVEGKKGTLVFTDLLRDEYRYREIQAPMGYRLDDTIRTAQKTDVIHTATISNTKVTEFALPKTGGVGTFWFTAGGALLIAGSLLLGYQQNKQRKRKGHV